VLRLNRYKDRMLSKRARRIAVRDNVPLFCYSYYASEAFRDHDNQPTRRFLFQLHPHPRSVREILQEEIEREPSARQSLMTEYELSLGPKEFDELALEPHLANGWIVASSYTRRTLSDQQIPASKIHVVPYGVDFSAFSKRSRPSDAGKPLTVIFVGGLIQRKGLLYLLNALRRLKTAYVRVLLCGRGFVDRRLLKQYADMNVEISIGLSRQDLVRRMHDADIFACPSLAEGFGHVILEAMSCGLPVIATPHTCAPDVMVDGRDGFIVPIRDSDTIAERLSWAIDHRAELAAMGESAAVQARLFTWERFRAGVRGAYKSMIASLE